ncbi:hypothetical protein Tco_0143409 [Tanacetum coccineum]
MPRQGVIPKSSIFHDTTSNISHIGVFYCRNLEALVIWAFLDHAHGILTALQAYMGNEVESTINKGKKKTGSKKFKQDIKGYIKTLVMAFQTIGVEDDLNIPIASSTIIFPSKCLQFEHSAFLEVPRE